MTNLSQLWDPRQKAAVEYLESNYPVCAVTVAEAGNEVYSGGIDNNIKVWDLRKKEIAYSLTGHADTITSLQVSPDGQALLSNSLDSSVKSWDIRPFAMKDRLTKTYEGVIPSLEKNLYKASWEPQNGQRIAAGCGDGSCLLWDARSGKLLNRLPGHKGAVNDVRISPDAERSSKLQAAYLPMSYSH